MSRRLSLAGMPNREQLLDEARRLGCRVVPVERTGEVRVSHPIALAPLTLNNRRKDGNVALRSLLRRLQGLER